MNPLTGLYGAATALRNTLFDRGVLRSRRLERPVVSVGNLSVGGSGKTPFVIALGELLKARAIRFDVLSRGYGRNTHGVTVVETDGNATDFGDEPLSSLQRADAIVLPRDFSGQNFSVHELTIESLARQGKLIWRMTREISMPAAPSAPIVFCGIARPQQFFIQVRASGITPAAEVEFRDHHPYDGSDIKRLLAMRGQLGGGGFLTTEKDATNLGSLQEDLKPCGVAALTLTLEHPTEVVEAILARTVFAKSGY